MSRVAKCHGAELRQQLGSQRGTCTTAAFWLPFQFALWLHLKVQSLDRNDPIHWIRKVYLMAIPKSQPDSQPLPGMSQTNCGGHVEMGAFFVALK